jgi:hypothetical protein
MGGLKKKKILKSFAAAVFLLFFAVSSIAALLIREGTAHEHNSSGFHNSCTVCEQIRLSEKQSQHIVMAAGGVFFALFGVFILTKSVKTTADPWGSFTLIAFKIRMNN